MTFQEVHILARKVNFREARADADFGRFTTSSGKLKQFFKRQAVSVSEIYDAMQPSGSRRMCGHDRKLSRSFRLSSGKADESCNVHSYFHILFRLPFAGRPQLF
jgi:hypothetical protein